MADTGSAPSTICPGCGDVCLLAENIATCERCETIYHESCWRQQGNHCTAVGCEDIAPRALDKQLTLLRGNLPIRVQSGQLTDSGLRLVTAAGERLLSWPSIQFIALGVIELDLTVETPRSAMRAMLRKLMGDQAQPNHHLRQIRETYLVDLWATGQDPPYRIDSSSVNYRSLLGEVSQASHRNFVDLLQRIVKASTDCKLDSSVVGLLTGKRYAIKHYASVYEFEMECNIWRSKPNEQTLGKSLQLPDEAARLPADWEE